MGTYSTLVKQIAVLIVLGTALAWAAPTEAKPWVAVTALGATAFFAIVSVSRHRQVMRLAEEVDEVLHSGRRVDFSNCREGDVAILANELAKMVARLARTRDQLELERNALADSLADISHQIRTPLTAAGLMLPIIERADDPRERIRAARELEMMLERVSWLVTALLKIAKVDAGAMRLDARQVLLVDVAREALLPLGTSLDLHDIEVRMDVDAQAAFVGDAKWTTEALGNIVKNCMEHTPAGGRISIVGAEDAVSTTIEVSDTGPGISEEDLPHVFERFYRGRESAAALGDRSTEDADSEAPARPTGFGIGLALAQALVSAQGGTLRAGNAAGGGARFEIAFPKMVV